MIAIMDEFWWLVYALTGLKLSLIKANPFMVTTILLQMIIPTLGTPLGTSQQSGNELSQPGASTSLCGLSGFTKVVMLIILKPEGESTTLMTL